ncbi:MAG: hypothetical protein V3V78_00480 [Candidatus Woesearchaeota archaeon]
MDKSYFFDRFVMRRNYREIIISLEQGDKKIKELATHSGMAYQHLCNVLQEAQKEGIITAKKKDHSLNFNLTLKGEIIKELCLGLKICIENWEEDNSIEALNKLSFIKKPEAEKEDPKIPKGSGQVITEPKDNKEGKNGNKPTEPGTE